MKFENEMKNVEKNYQEYVETINSRFQYIPLHVLEIREYKKITQMRMRLWKFGTKCIKYEKDNSLWYKKVGENCLALWK